MAGVTSESAVNLVADDLNLIRPRVVSPFEAGRRWFMAGKSLADEVGLRAAFHPMTLDQVALASLGYETERLWRASLKLEVPTGDTRVPEATDLRRLWHEKTRQERLAKLDAVIEEAGAQVRHDLGLGDRRRDKSIVGIGPGHFIPDNS